MSALSKESKSRHLSAEQVVLLDESSKPIGFADKTRVHSDSTPLHLAFSCYLFDSGGRVLMTRRALSKPTWPGVWTNSFCGHPQPGESLPAAVERRARQELGVDICDLRLLDPHFRYRATDSNGVIENEICPVYAAVIAGALSPQPDEVLEWAWMDPASLRQAVALTPFVFSPWMVLQMPALERATNMTTTARSDDSETPRT